MLFLRVVILEFIIIFVSWLMRKAYPVYTTRPTIQSVFLREAPESRKLSLSKGMQSLPCVSRPEKWYMCLLGSSHSNSACSVLKMQ